MRTKNSLKNIIGSVSSNILTIIIGLVSQIIFVKILGSEYLGINGLFKSIISMLSIAELGIGSAIVYKLYEPLATNNKKKIKSLIYFYKKSYQKIAFAVLLLGMFILPFIPNIVGQVNIDKNIYIIYLLFIIEAVLSYLFTYKRSMLQADQKNYYINIIHILYLVLLNIGQIVLLLLTKNYYLYLILKIICRVLENVIINMIVNKKYSFIREKQLTELEDKEQYDINKKIKSLFLHKIGSFTVNGTDNILISMFFGVINVGIYSNYMFVINSIRTVANQIFTSMIPSVGNLLVVESKDKKFETYKKIEFLNLWINIFCTACLLILTTPFIKICFGVEYSISIYVLIPIIINFYLSTLRYKILAFKEAAGIFYEDRFMPILESLINIVASLILLSIFGLAGIFMGTVVSNLLLILYSYPKYVYEPIFDRSKIEYYIKTIKHIFLSIIIVAITYFVTMFISINNNITNLIVKSTLCIIIPNILMIIIFYKTDEFKYFTHLLKKLTKRGVKNEK